MIFRGLFGRMGREFREFIARGNAVDLAVGVSVGTAFSRLLSSFVENIVSPPLRWGFDTLSGFKASVVGATGFDWSPPSSGPGRFVGELATFALLAFSTFLVAKLVNRFKRRLENRAGEVSPKAQSDAAHEDPAARQIAQNDRIIELLEQLNAKR